MAEKTDHLLSIALGHMGSICGHISTVFQVSAGLPCYCSGALSPYAHIGIPHLLDWAGRLRPKEFTFRKTEQ